MRQKTQAAPPARSLTPAAAAAIVAISLGAPPALAQTPDAPVGEDELRRQLELRDAVIVDLLRRVEQLERATGADAGARPAPAVEAAPEAPIMGEPPAEPPAESRAGGAPPQPPAPEPPPSAETAQTDRPARQPGQLEVDEEAAERALERALVETGALLLPAGTMEVVPRFSYVRRERERPGDLALSLDQTQFVTAEDLIRSNEFETGLTFRLGLPLEAQLDLDIPYRYEDISRTTRIAGAGLSEDTANLSGFGDLRLTLRKAVLEEGLWAPNLFASLAWDSDTGETEDGLPLGSGFHELTAALTATKRQDPLVFTGSLSYTTAFEDDGIDPGDEFGLSAGAVLAVSPETSLRFTPRLIFQGESELDGADVPGSDQTLGLLTLGASSVLGRGILLDVATDIGLTEDAPDFGIFVSLPIRFDTGLF